MKVSDQPKYMGFSEQGFSKLLLKLVCNKHTNRTPHTNRNQDVAWM